MIDVEHCFTLHVVFDGQEFEATLVRPSFPFSLQEGHSVQLIGMDEECIVFSQPGYYELERTNSGAAQSQVHTYDSRIEVELSSSMGVKCPCRPHSAAFQMLLKAGWKLNPC
jgi:hypothetical protein